MQVLSFLLTLGFGAFAVYELVTFIQLVIKAIKKKKAKKSEEENNLKKED